jgi:hypothetical protein
LPDTTEERIPLMRDLAVELERNAYRLVRSTPDIRLEAAQDILRLAKGLRRKLETWKER